MYERKGDDLLPFPSFLKRVGLAFLLALGVAAVALLVGTLGYHYLACLGWLDAELNAAMILTGMGPVDPMKTNAAKIFASGYALFSGIVFLTSMGIVLSPVFHRVIHKFHLDDDDDQKKKKRRSSGDMS
jgi:hypothetical protein